MKIRQTKFKQKKDEPSSSQLLICLTMSSLSKPEATEASTTSIFANIEPFKLARGTKSIRTDLILSSFRTTVRSNDRSDLALIRRDFGPPVSLRRNFIQSK